jgi:hypothetical protein
MKPAEIAAAATKAYSLGTVIVRDMVGLKNGCYSVMEAEESGT